MEEMRNGEKEEKGSESEGWEREKEKEIENEKETLGSEGRKKKWRSGKGWDSGEQRRILARSVAERKLFHSWGIQGLLPTLCPFHPPFYTGLCLTA